MRSAFQHTRFLHTEAQAESACFSAKNGKSSDLRQGGKTARGIRPPFPHNASRYAVVAFRPASFDASDFPYAYSAGCAGLFTPFHLRPVLTQGLYGPDDRFLFFS